MMALKSTTPTGTGWLLATIAVALTVTLTMATGSPAQIAVITLRDTVMVSQPVIRLSDVAQIEVIDSTEYGLRGVPRDDGMAAKLQDLDLAEFRYHTQVIELDRSLMAIRMQIAGFSPERYQFRGAGQTHISFAHPLSEDRVTTAVRRSVSEYLGLPESDVVLELQGHMTPPADLPWNRPLTVKVELPTPIRMDPLRIRLSVYDESQLLRILPVVAVVKVRQMALVAKQRIAASELIGGNNATVRETEIPAVAWMSRARPTAGRTTAEDAMQSALDLFGTFAVRPIMPGDVIVPQDVNATPDVSRLAIAARDRVRLVAQRKGLTVTLQNAEALEKGSVGDTIRVRNPASGRVVLGRISPNGDVLVTF